MRFIRKLVAALALTLALPAGAQALPAKLTITKVAPDTATQFPFTLTGPKCDVFPTGSASFTLAGGQSKVFSLCPAHNVGDTPNKAGRYVITEGSVPGWQTPSIACTGRDTSLEDAFIIEPPSAFVEFSPGERKACTFTNAVAPTPPTTPTTTPPAPPPPVSGSPAEQPSSGVAGEQVSSPRRPAVSVRAQATCPSGAASAAQVSSRTRVRMVVRGRLMRQVRFSIDGRRVRTLNVPRGALVVRALVPLRSSGPANQTVTTRVTFRNGAAPRTFRTSARRCLQAVSPQFTG
jgi:hypothetical protein